MTTQTEILEQVLKDLKYYQQYGAKVILETAIFDLEHVIKEPPASKPWVGLTEEEIQPLLSQNRFAVFALARAIEAKLKEKNA